MYTPRRLVWIAIDFKTRPTVTKSHLKFDHELHQLLDVSHQESLEEEWENLVLQFPLENLAEVA